MTPEELLGLLDLSRGSSPDPISVRLPPRPSLPMPSAPVTGIGNAAETSPYARMDASGMGDPGILERIGARAPHSGIAALIDLTGTLLRGGHSGYGDAVKRAKLNAASDTLTNEHTDARLAAEKAKKDARDAIVKERTKAMQDATAGHVNEIERVNAALLQPHPQETIDALKAKRMKHKAALQKLKTDYNALTGQELLAADVPDDTELPGVTPKPEKGPAATGAGTNGGTIAVSDQARALAKDIAEGRRSPGDVSQLSGRSVNGMAPMRDQVSIALSELGVDVGQLAKNWQADKTFTATVNGRQFTMLRASQQGIVDALTPLWAANKAAAAKVPLTRSGGLNKPISWATNQGFLGRDAQDALTERTNKAALTVEPLASVLRNGGMPTDQAQHLAEKIIAIDPTTPPSVYEKQILSTLEGMGLRKEAFDAVAPQGLAPGKGTFGPSKPAAAPAADFDPMSIPGARRVVPVKGHTRKVGGK